MAGGTKSFNVHRKPTPWCARLEIEKQVPSFLGGKSDKLTSTRIPRGTCNPDIRENRPTAFAKLRSSP